MKQAMLSLALGLAVAACSTDKTAATTANDLALSSARVSEEAKLPRTTPDEAPACSAYTMPCRITIWPFHWGRCCGGLTCRYHYCQKT
jgi:hypothetical protein